MVVSWEVHFSIGGIWDGVPSKCSCSISVAQDYVVVEVNHILWYHLRARVVSIRCSFSRWVVAYFIVFHERRSVIRIGKDKSMWIVTVNIEFSCCVDSVRKRSVVSRSDVWVVVRIMICFYGRLKIIWVLGNLVIIVWRCLETLL